MTETTNPAEISQTPDHAVDKLAMNLFTIAAESFDPHKYGFVDKVYKDGKPPYREYTFPTELDAPLQIYPYRNKLNVITANALTQRVKYADPRNDKDAAFSEERVGKGDFSPDVVAGFYYTPTTLIEPSTYDTRKGQHFYTGGEPAMHILIWGNHEKALQDALGVQPHQLDMGVRKVDYDDYGSRERHFTLISVTIDPKHPKETEDKMRKVLDKIMPYAETYEQKIHNNY